MSTRDGSDGDTLLSLPIIIRERIYRYLLQNTIPIYIAHRLEKNRKFRVERAYCGAYWYIPWDVLEFRWQARSNFDMLHASSSKDPYEQLPHSAILRLGSQLMRKKGHGVTDFLQPAILRVCHQTYIEAFPILYRDRVFLIHKNLPPEDLYSMLSVEACRHIRHIAAHSPESGPWDLSQRGTSARLRHCFPNLVSYEGWMEFYDAHDGPTGAEIFLLNWSSQLSIPRIAELPDILDPAATALWNVFFWYFHLASDCELRQFFEQPSLRSTTLISSRFPIGACIVLKRLDQWFPYRPVTLLEVSIQLNCPSWPEDAEALRAWDPTFADFDLDHPITNESRGEFEKALRNVGKAIKEGVLDNKFSRHTKAFFELENFVNWRNRSTVSRGPRSLTSFFLRQLGLVENPEIIRAAESCTAL